MSTYDYNKTPVALDRLLQEIGNSSITVALDSATTSVYGPNVVIGFKANISAEEKAELDGIVSSHDGTPLENVDHTHVILDENKSKDDLPLFTPKKSYSDKSKSFTTPDYSCRRSWYGDYNVVEDEVMTTSDQLVYSSPRTPNAGWGHDWLEWTWVPNHFRQSTPGAKVIVKKNDIVVTTGFTINYASGTVTFSVANASEDVIKVSYYYANSSKFDLIPSAGKKVLIDYVETQFSVGCTMPGNAAIMFTAIYNGPAVPAYGILENTDVPVSNYEYYNAKDFLNESTQAYVVKAFMELTLDVNILPWNYLTGHTMKPPGDATTDITKNEFNKLRFQLLNLSGDPDPIITDCEIATGTVYCNIEDL